MSRRDALALDILLGLAVHLWFNKHEPVVSWSLFAILAVAPTPPAALLCEHMTALHSALVAYSLFFGTLFTSIVIYRISPIHPLAKYPGPVLCKVSQLWTVWIVSGGKQHQYRKTLHDAYGPVVRIGPNELSIADKDLLPAILGTQGMPKGPLFSGRRLTPISDKNSENYSLISSRDPQRHAQLRKPWNKAFANSPLKDYEELMVHRALQLIEELQGLCQQQPDGVSHVDIARWINFFSFDFMGDLAFNGGFELMRDGDKDGLLRRMSSALFYPAMCQHVPWFSPILRAVPYVGAPMRAFGKFAFQRTQSRYTQEVKRKDLFYYLTEAIISDSGTSPFPLILANSVLAIIAGSDTTSSVLSNIVYYLISNPTDYARLREEVDLVFRPTETSSVHPELFTEMPFLNAVINEVLRLQPPVPSSLQRAPMLGSGGKLVGPHYIKEGTAIQVPPYTLHRDPRYFYPLPDEFWPERWLKSSTEETGDKFVCDRGAFIPFSMGPANCVGKPLAMFELKTIVSLLVMHFEMKFDDGFDPKSWERGLKDHLVLAKGELMVKMVLRERVSVVG
ncbi:high nitrogen upregulated cytochrome P450 monooxygenase 2 [Leucogyrophana mollusca]|uniref:High nitrogen upregulated cytochrome P450 monooxygenase 2 n=1 Tax=Leucogyrophana mollusca TaxID=85980 RepID=A0ACB8BYN6_9AGAM|nr:high nitrogen upregulated cytochrome P450 monooxygenase 2 [Leucogyrophana mollusca]